MEERASLDPPASKNRREKKKGLSHEDFGLWTTNSRGRGKKRKEKFRQDSVCIVGVFQVSKKREKKERKMFKEENEVVNRSEYRERNL